MNRTLHSANSWGRDRSHSPVTQNAIKWTAFALVCTLTQLGPFTPIAGGQQPPLRTISPIAQDDLREGQQSDATTPLFPADTDKTSKSEAIPKLTSEQKQQADRCIESLGSGTFAVRERVALELVELGPAVLPHLRDEVEKAEDPEVRFRINQIVKQLTRGDIQARIGDFLAGKDVGFPGWRIAETVLGDSIGIRQLYVELLTEYPLLPASLEGETRDRVLALESAITKVQRRLFIERVMPNSADAFALLLPTADQQVPVNKTFEDLMLGLLNKETATKIRKDAQLSGPFELLLSHWIPRSSLSNREDVLLFGMDWDLARPTLGLAIQTLNETTQVENLVIAMQAVAKYGNPGQTEIVRIFLDDKRQASDGGFSDDGPTETRLGDIAIATIARLNGISLKEIGFETATRHEKLEFIPSEIGFPIDDDSKRNAARAKIDELIQMRKVPFAPPPPRPQ